MKDLDLKKAAKLLPHGSVAEISFNVRIVQPTVSKILQGKEMKGADKVKIHVAKMLVELKKNIDEVLSESGNDSINNRTISE